MHIIVAITAIVFAVAVIVLSHLAVAVVVTTDGFDLPSRAQLVTCSCHLTACVNCIG